jgi:hypothetical protein
MLEDIYNTSLSMGVAYPSENFCSDLPEYTVSYPRKR